MDYELDACVDCMLAIANGADEETPRDTIAGLEAWSAHGVHLISGSAEGDDDLGFCHGHIFPCDICESRLGGDRFRVYGDIIKIKA